MKRTGRIGLAVFLFVGLVVSMFGCLNVDQPNVPPTNFTSNVKFVDLANTGTNMVATFDNGTSAATLTYGNNSAYVTMPAGSRRMKFVYGATTDTLRQAFASYGQYTYFSVFDPANGDVARTYISFGQSYTFSSAGVVDTALVRFINLSTDTAFSFASGMDFMLGGKSVATGVAFGQVAGYFKVPAGNSNYEVFATSADTTGGTPLISTTTLSGLASQGRYSIVVYGNHASINKSVIQEH